MSKNQIPTPGPLDAILIIVRLPRNSKCIFLLTGRLCTQFFCLYFKRSHTSGGSKMETNLSQEHPYKRDFCVKICLEPSREFLQIPHCLCGHFWFDAVHNYHHQFLLQQRRQQAFISNVRRVRGKSFPLWNSNFLHSGGNINSPSIRLLRSFKWQLALTKKSCLWEKSTDKKIATWLPLEHCQSNLKTLSAIATLECQTIRSHGGRF